MNSNAFRPRSLSSYTSLSKGDVDGAQGESGVISLLLGGVAGEGVYLYATHPGNRKQRIRLGDCEEKETESRSHIVRVNKDTFVLFYGYRHVKKNVSLRIWVWRLGEERASAVEISKGTSVAGFGDAAVVRSSLSTGTTRRVVTFATGLGKGVARLWALDLENEASITLLGAYKAKHSTLCTFLILSDDETTNSLLTGTSYGCIQQWTFDVESQRSEPVEKGSRDCTFLSKSDTKTLLGDSHPDFLEDVRNPDCRPDVLEYVQKTESSEYWKELFPTTALDPFAYVGDVDASGRPHGQGSRVFEDGFRFEGQWEHGEPVDGRVSGKNHYEYEGEVRGTAALPHGLGREARHCGGAEIEVYYGGWRNGERHGLGSLSWKHTNPSRSKCHGIREWGFFHSDKPHGLMIHEWDVDAPELPFAQDMEEEIKRLGPIRCFQMHVHGKFFDEFNFHRADGKRWSPGDEKLLNVVPRSDGPETFASNPRHRGELCGRSCRMECWACMKEEGDDSKVYSCVRCSMRVHRSAECAWPPRLFEEAFLGKAWLCIMCREDVESSQCIAAYDRHGERVVLRDAADISELLPSRIPSATSSLKVYHG